MAFGSITPYSERLFRSQLQSVLRLVEYKYEYNFEFEYHLKVVIYLSGSNIRH